MAERRLSRGRREPGSASATVLEIAESGVRRGGGELGAEGGGDGDEMGEELL